MIGFAPIVMVLIEPFMKSSFAILIKTLIKDLLNMKKNLMHHYQSLGGWTVAFGN